VELTDDRAELTDDAQVAMPGRKFIVAVSVIVALASAAGCRTSARSTTSVTSPGSANAGPFASISSTRSLIASEPLELVAAHRALALAAAHQEASQIAVGRNIRQVAGWPSGISPLQRQSDSVP